MQDKISTQFQIVKEIHCIDTYIITELTQKIFTINPGTTRNF